MSSNQHKRGTPSSISQSFASLWAGSNAIGCGKIDSSAHGCLPAILQKHVSSLPVAVKKGLGSSYLNRECQTPYVVKHMDEPVEEIKLQQQLEYSDRG
jgi:hypothetical protein